MKAPSINLPQPINSSPLGDSKVMYNYGETAYEWLGGVVSVSGEALVTVSMPSFSEGTSAVNSPCLCGFHRTSPYMVSFKAKEGNAVPGSFCLTAGNCCSLWNASEYQPMTITSWAVLDHTPTMYIQERHQATNIQPQAPGTRWELVLELLHREQGSVLNKELSLEPPCQKDSFPNEVITKAVAHLRAGGCSHGPSFKPTSSFWKLNSWMLY